MEHSGIIFDTYFYACLRQARVTNMRLTDLETGEVFLGLAMAFKKKYPREIQQDGFFTMFMFGSDFIGELDDLSGADYRILFKMLSHLEFQNWIYVTHQTIADELQLKRSNVSRSIKKLIERGVIEKQKDPKDKRRMIYRLNPACGWRGDANQWKKEMYDRKTEKVTPLFPNRDKK